MRPSDVATTETVEFVGRHIPGRCQILEVGCGDGEVALALSQRQYQVRALDSAPERIAKARELGVHAIVASWPDFEIDPVDAIVFTRSLHHINPLPEAIGRARQLLKPEGVLLVEDFAVESVTEPTLNWFRESLRREPFHSVFEAHQESFVNDLLAAANPIQLWQDHHTAHGVRRFDLLQRLVAESFPNCVVQFVPYLYRYLISGISDDDKSANIVRQFLRNESEAADRNAINLIGRRIVARAV